MGIYVKTFEVLVACVEFSFNVDKIGTIFGAYDHVSFLSFFLFALRGSKNSIADELKTESFERDTLLCPLSKPTLGLMKGFIP